MDRYVIHTCNARRWYVDKFLIPSLAEQGIEDVKIEQDKRKKGCLESYMQCFKKADKEGGQWHLQDDIIISDKFAERTELMRRVYGDEVICGLCTRYDKSQEAGIVPLEKMWYSFPCIYIPNKLARECAEWFYNGEYKDENINLYRKWKKCEDETFKIFLKERHPQLYVVNVAPNLVNHIDYLIGGSVVNSERADGVVEAVYWEELDLLDKWKEILKNG